jgi:DNA mismatch repair protein MLH3
MINKAIDANSTSIDVLIDTEKFSLQVNDNGYGIQNMCKIGQRHGEF